MLEMLVKKGVVEKIETCAVSSACEKCKVKCGCETSNTGNVLTKTAYRLKNA